MGNASGGITGTGTGIVGSKGAAVGGRRSAVGGGAGAKTGCADIGGAAGAAGATPGIAAIAAANPPGAAGAAGIPNTVFCAERMAGAAGEDAAVGGGAGVVDTAVEGADEMAGPGAIGAAPPTIGGMPNTVFIARPAAGLGVAAEDPGGMGVPGAVKGAAGDGVRAPGTGTVGATAGG
ncbi:MAG: hypothetical protein HY907_09715 [Deltaproteobacteria bacterium]|nr:hypothetical protein [Deltaproteobacteria bacterium]